MKPAYDQLAAEYEGHAKVVVMDVDCTVEKELCSSQVREQNTSAGDTCCEYLLPLRRRVCACA
jgi:hypothetical protein